MNDTDKTKEHLIQELQEIRQRNAALEHTIHDLTATRQRLETMLHTLMEGVVMVNTDGEIVYANVAAEQILDLRKDNIVGRYYHERVWKQIDKGGHPYLQDWLPLDVALRERKIVEGLEYGIIASDRQVKWLLVHVAPLVDEQGGVSGAIANFTDVTERKQVKESLQESEEKYRTLLESITDSVYVLDRQWKHIVVNEAGAQFTHIPKEKLINTSLLELFPGVEQSTFFQTFQRVMCDRKSEVVEDKFIFLDGRVGWYEVRVYPVPEGILCISKDITERKQIEQTLKESEERLRNIFEMALDMICIADIETATFLKINPAFTTILGYREEELLERPFLDFIHPDDVVPTIEVIEKELQKGTKVLHFINRYRCKDGTYRWLDWMSHPNPEKGITYAIAHDITDQKKAEQALKKSEERFDLALKGADLGLWDWFVQTGKVVFNKRWAEMLEYSLDEIGPSISTWEKLVHPDDMPLVSKVLHAHLEGKTPFYETEHRMKTKSGAWKWILDRGKVLERDNHGKPLRAVGTHLDITDRKQTEHQLREANATKDRFFSIIAHDIKNPFLAILTGTKILQERLQSTDDDLTLTIVRELYTTTQRVYKLLENLLTWARMQQGAIPYNPDRINLCYSVHLCLQLLHDQAAHKQITLTCLLEQETLVHADLPMLDTILRNLISNAIKFTPKKGAVTIKAQEHDDFVEIIVMDTGMGMCADKLQKLFIPGEKHVSSRDTEGEQGTGLGLILCKEFVERHGGQIWAESEVGRGSTFTFTLPKGDVGRRIHSSGS